MTGTVTTWLDGRVQTVPAEDARLAEEQATRVRLMHVANLRRINLRSERGNYLANVERKEGAEARAALEAAFRADWESRR